MDPQSLRLIWNDVEIYPTADKLEEKPAETPEDGIVVITDKEKISIPADKLIEIFMNETQYIPQVPLSRNSLPNKQFYPKFKSMVNLNK